MTKPGPTTPPVPLQLKRGGGDAFIVEHSATSDFVTLASTAPSPPGSTVEAVFNPAGSLPRPDTGAQLSVTVRVKVRGCRRDTLPDAREGFRIEGRFVSLTRGDREALFGSQIEAEPRSTSET